MRKRIPIFTTTIKSRVDKGVKVYTPENKADKARKALSALLSSKSQLLLK